jgi:hypothetical protein
VVCNGRHPDNPEQHIGFGIQGVICDECNGLLQRRKALVLQMKELQKQINEVEIELGFIKH